MAGHPYLHGKGWERLAGNLGKSMKIHVNPIFHGRIESNPSQILGGVIVNCLVAG